MYYQITGELKRLKKDQIPQNDFFAALLTPQEWEEQKEALGYPKQAGQEYTKIHSCKADVYSKYIFGAILCPDKDHLLKYAYELVYYINEKSIVIIDDGTLASRILCRIVQKYQHQEITPELFLYGFLQWFIKDDIQLLETFEKKLFSLEETALSGKIHNLMPDLLLCRRELTRLNCYYQQLEDMARELEENEKGYFDEKRLNYIHLLGDRAGRLFDSARQLTEYCQTLREVYQAEIDHRQNRHMQFLTVITSIFFPLTLITGWYGMNFTNIPEIHSPWGYLIIILVSLSIIAGEVIYFKKKKIL